MSQLKSYTQELQYGYSFHIFYDMQIIQPCINNPENE
jgi:hypothetical protein